VVYIHNGVLLSHKEEWNYVVCRWMNETGEHHVKQRKSGSKGQKSHVFPHMWKLDLKDTCVHKYIHVCVYTKGGGNSGTVWEERKMIVSDSQIHCIWAQRWHRETCGGN
jgi:hypothetical protein